MTETFAQYLERWLKLSAVQGLTNPLAKIPHCPNTRVLLIKFTRDRCRNLPRVSVKGAGASCSEGLTNKKTRFSAKMAFAGRLR